MGRTGRDRLKKDGNGNYFEERDGSSKAKFHVVPRDEKKMHSEKEGKEKPIFNSKDRGEAVDKAKKRAEEAGTKVIYHNLIRFIDSIIFLEAFYFEIEIISDSMYL